jgi:hypothetical protein
LIDLSDARLVASVLPDRDFVQMPGAGQNKFKWSVAGALHPGHPIGPKLEQVNDSTVAPGPLNRQLPLTADNAAGFNPGKGWGIARWRMIPT